MDASSAPHLQPPRPEVSRPAPGRIRVRWKLFPFLFGFGFMAYVQSHSLSVAGERMMPELHLTQEQLGWLLTAMTVGYTLMQFPGGLIGQRLGARRTFLLISLLAVATVLVTAGAPLLFSGSTLFVVLLLAQFLLGASQGPIFPVSAGVFERWYLPRQWPIVQGIQTLGLGLGAAAAAPFIAQLMQKSGWQWALVWTIPLALLLVAGWYRYGHNTPAGHPAVSAEELAELGDGAVGAPERLTWSRVRALLSDRNVLLLAVSYLSMNYAFYLLSFWIFLYLVQHWHVTLSESGWLAMAPQLASALGAGVGGILCSGLCARLGTRRGFRAVPLVALPAAGLLLLGATVAGNAYLALSALTLSFFCVELNEGAYWAGIMHVGRRDAMAASGIMNTGGNLGGVIATPIVAALTAHQAWTSAFALGAVCVFVCALLWLFVKLD